MKHWKFCGVALVALATSPLFAKEIVVAQVAPFGGPLAISGRDFNLGAMIAFDEINARGGIAGNRLKLISRDDGYRSADTAQHVSQLIAQDKPIALIGMWGAENIAAVVDKGMLVNSGLPVVGVRSGVAALRNNPNLFHVRASYRDEVQRILDQIRTMGSTRIAVVYEDDGFGKEAWVDVQEMLATRSLKAAAVAVQPKNSLNVDSAVSTIAVSQPQAVLLVANTPVAAAMIKALKGKKLPLFIFATSTVDAEQLVAQLGDVAAGVAVAQSVPNPYKATAPVARAFQNRLKALGLPAERGNFASLEGYIVAQVVAEGLKRSGRDPSTKDLVRGLESMKQVDLGGFVVDFAPNQHEGSRYVDLSLIGAGGHIRQ